MKKYLIVLILALFSNKLAFSQKSLSPNEINKKITDVLSFDNWITTVTKKLKDSVDLYAFSIELKVSVKNKKTVVNAININDSIAYVFFNNFDSLKSINYYSIVGDKKKATIVIPVAVIIAYTNKPVHSTPLLSAESLYTKIPKLFNYKFDDRKNGKNISSFIYLDPIITLSGTIVHD